LDLFCGAGGAAMGYHRAGFDVVGVDIEPQPHYPFEFIQEDALAVLGQLLDDPGELEEWLPFDAIHASPPCQAFTRARSIQRRDHADLLTPTRELLRETGLPWVMENVPGAPMRIDYELCGTTFGLTTRRHRWFEVSWGPVAHLHAPCVEHKDAPVLVFGHTGGVSKPGRPRFTRRQWQEALGIDWMTNKELAQAIPPAYTEFIGAQLLRAVLVAQP
jgi:DNA (cytosine-5)-methyltransferase 1